MIVAGDDGVPVRVREELEGLGFTVICVCEEPEGMAARAAREAGARLVVGDPALARTWEEAGLDRALAVGVLGSDDLKNLNSGLLAAELTDTIPLVVRLFASGLASGVETLFAGRAVVLSATEVAAPAFLQAALSGNTGQRVTIAGRVLEVAEVAPDDPTLVVALCNADTPTFDLLPGPERSADLVLGLVDRRAPAVVGRGALPGRMGIDQAARAGRRRRSVWARALGTLRAVPRRMVILVAVIATVFSTSVAVFALGEHLDLLDSVYFTATTMATVGYGDINLLDASDLLKIYDVGLMLVSALLIAAFLALFTEVLVSSRIDRALGRFPIPRENHVIVCGLGRAGARIIAGLHVLEVPCVGIEQYEEATGIGVARSLEIPVVIGDARQQGVLDRIHVDGARALMAVTDDDLANLEAGLVAHERNPDLRVVLRCFDADLAERLDRTVELDLTRSVAALAAPAFAAALLGRPLATPLPLSNVPLRVLETVVPGGSPFDGATVAAVEAAAQLRVVTIGSYWRPAPDAPIHAGENVAVVGTREACDELLRAA